jgi:hypothetical protein
MSLFFAYTRRKDLRSRLDQRGQLKVLLGHELDLSQLTASELDLSQLTASELDLSQLTASELDLSQLTASGQLTYYATMLAHRHRCWLLSAWSCPHVSDTDGEGGLPAIYHVTACH